MDTHENPLQSRLTRLASRVDDMATELERLRRENRSLLTQREGLLDERAKLKEKNELAKVRVDAMISRLRSLESNPEKLALVAAMNMTSQLLKARSGSPDFEALLGVLSSIEASVDVALADKGDEAIDLPEDSSAEPTVQSS